MNTHRSRPLSSLVLCAAMALSSLFLGMTPAGAACCQFAASCQDDLNRTGCANAGGVYKCGATCQNGSCVYLALTPEPDATAPLCVMTRYAGGPPTQIDITAQDTGSGLAEVSVINSDNSTVTVPSFIFGTTDPVVITATKSNQSLPSRINLAVGDVEGNCTLCDPILTHILTGKGNGRVQTFTEVDAVERIVTVTNGSPGLKSFEILVNGRKFRLSKLKNSERRSLDISRAMLAGARNVLTLYGNGVAGSRADILIWDGGSQ